MAIFSPMVTTYGAGTETAANFQGGATGNILTRQAQALMAAAQMAGLRKKLQAEERENIAKWGFQREQMGFEADQRAADRQARADEAAAGRTFEEGMFGRKTAAEQAAEAARQRNVLEVLGKQQSFQGEETEKDRTLKTNLLGAELAYKREADQIHNDIERGKLTLAEGQLELEKTRQKHQEYKDALDDEFRRKDPKRLIEWERLKVAKALGGEAEGVPPTAGGDAAPAPSPAPFFSYGVPKRPSNYVERWPGSEDGSTPPGSPAPLPKVLPGVDVASAGQVALGGGDPFAGPITIGRRSTTGEGARNPLDAALSPSGPPSQNAGGFTGLLGSMSPEDKNTMYFEALDLKAPTKPKSERDETMGRVLAGAAEAGALALRTYFDTHPQLTLEERLQASQQVSDRLERLRASLRVQPGTAPAANAAPPLDAQVPILPGSGADKLGAALARQAGTGGDPFRDQRSGRYLPGLVELAAKTKGLAAGEQKAATEEWETQQVQAAIEEVMRRHGKDASDPESNPGILQEIEPVLAARVGEQVARRMIKQGSGWDGPFSVGALRKARYRVVAR